MLDTEKCLYLAKAVDAAKEDLHLKILDLSSNSYIN